MACHLRTARYVLRRQALRCQPQAPNLTFHLAVLQFSFFAATAISLWALRRWRIEGTAKLTVIGAMYFVATMVAVSRVYLGYHSTAQILVGSTAGVLSGAVWTYITEKVRASSAKLACTSAAGISCLHSQHLRPCLRVITHSFSCPGSQSGLALLLGAHCAAETPLTLKMWWKLSTGQSKPTSTACQRASPGLRTLAGCEHRGPAAWALSTYMHHIHMRRTLTRCESVAQGWEGMQRTGCLGLQACHCLWRRRQTEGAAHMQ